jgi:O-antigen ligase/polysaccharide polymerase Wzy-like membrane protein
MRLRLTAPMAFAVAVAGFIGLAALSYWNRAVAIYAVLAWCALVIAVMPMVGWVLTVFAVPFQNLFAISSRGFGSIRSVVLVLLTARLSLLLVQRRTYRSPLLWLLLAFAVMASLHEVVLGASAGELVWDTLFFLALGSVYVVSREFSAQPTGMALAGAALIGSALVSGVVTFLFLYVPLPGLVYFHQPIDDLRLFAVQDSPNVLAKLLMVSLLFLVCRVAWLQQGRRYIVPFVPVNTFLLAATASRSVLLAAASTLLFLFPVANRSNLRILRVWSIVVLALGGYAAWMVSSPWIDRHAAEQWVARNQENLDYYLETSEAPPGLVGQIGHVVLRDLRLDASYVMTKIDGRTGYRRRSFQIMEMGQRDRTWKAGLKIVAEHWAWGIGGPQQWARYMQEILSYPFSSPHNALLEVTGGYGVLGLVLYLSVIALFVRNYLSMKKLVREPWQRIANEATLLCGVATFLAEMTDTLTVFGIFELQAIWFWVIAGLQAGLRDALHQETAAQAKGGAANPQDLLETISSRLATVRRIGAS